AKPPLEIVSATYFGSAADGDVQGAAAAEDGTLYVVGNTATPATDLPGGAKPTTFGSPAPSPRCGCGFVAHLSADGKKLLDYAQFAPGVALLTTAQVAGPSVYVSGYASDGLAAVIKDRPGLIHDFPLR